MKGILTNKPVQVTILSWIALSILLGFAISSRGLPFLDRLPIFHGKSGLEVLKSAQLNGVFGLVILGLVLLITRSRREKLSVPGRVTANRELKYLLAYLGLYDRVSRFEVMV